MKLKICVYRNEVGDEYRWDIDDGTDESRACGYERTRAMARRRAALVKRALTAKLPTPKGA